MHLIHSRTATSLSQTGFGQQGTQGTESGSHSGCMNLVFSVHIHKPAHWHAAVKDSKLLPGSWHLCSVFMSSQVGVSGSFEYILFSGVWHISVELGDSVLACPGVMWSEKRSKPRSRPGQQSCFLLPSLRVQRGTGCWHRAKMGWTQICQGWLAGDLRATILTSFHWNTSSVGLQFSLPSQMPQKKLNLPKQGVAK